MALLITLNKKKQFCVVKDKDGNLLGKICVAQTNDRNEVKLAFEFLKEIKIDREKIVIEKEKQND